MADEINLDDWLNEEIVPSNSFIADKDSALGLVASFLGAKGKKKESEASDVFQEKVEKIFSLFRDVSLPDELLLYRCFQNIGERLRVIQKAYHLSDKTIVGFGGKFSSGKSSFINSISGIEGLLPEAQEATTSIPTYIIFSSEEHFTANTVFGDVCQLSREAMEALTHIFNREYNINCAPFIDSIIVETPKFALDSRIALLDTPGYTKHDDDSNSKMVVSDRLKAHEQLRVTDYLIWLVDMDNGTLTQDDIDFIDSLEIKTKILIVFNKADLRTESDRKEIIDKAIDDTKFMSTPVFGVAAYSSKENIEYTGHIIQDFFSEVAESKIHNNDIRQQLRDNVKAMQKAISSLKKTHEKTAEQLFDVIVDSQSPTQLSSMARLWSNESQSAQMLDALSETFEEASKELELYLSNVFQEMKNNE